MIKSALIISDLHAPYTHPDTYAFLAAMKAKYKPDLVLLTGDEIDHHAISFHNSDPDLPSAGRELENAIEVLKPIYRMFPKAIILESNHGSLVYRKGVAHGLSRRVFKGYNEILEAPKGWEWHSNYTFKTRTGPVYCTHGITSTPGKLASMYGCSTIQGHYHSNAQVFYVSTPERLLFDMIVACMIDYKSLNDEHEFFDI
jgi:predicted phosphodiesterase